MNAIQRRCLLSVLLLATGLRAQDPPGARDDAAARIEKHGGSIQKILRNSDALEVDLQGSEIADADLADLVLLKNVQVLRLKETSIGDAGLSHVGKIATLKRLFLDKTAVTDAGLSHLAGLKELEFVNLYGTSVGDGGLAHLKKIDSLKTIIVTESKVTAGGADAFHKGNPKLQIIPNLAQNREHAAAAWQIAKAALENAQAELDEAKKNDAELTPQIAQLKANSEAAGTMSADAKKRADEAKALFEEANKKVNELKKLTDELKKQVTKDPSNALLKGQLDKQTAELESAEKEAAPLRKAFEEAQAASQASMAVAKELGQMVSRASGAKKRVDEAQKRLDAMRQLEEYNRTNAETFGNDSKQR